MINDIVENDDDRVKKSNKSPKPIVLKMDVLSLNLAYKLIINTNRKINMKLYFIDK